MRKYTELSKANIFNFKELATDISKEEIKVVFQNLMYENSRESIHSRIEVVNEWYVLLNVLLVDGRLTKKQILFVNLYNEMVHLQTKIHNVLVDLTLNDEKEINNSSIFDEMGD